MRFRHNLKCFHGNIKCMVVVGNGWEKGLVNPLHDISYILCVSMETYLDEMG